MVVQDARRSERFVADRAVVLLGAAGGERLRLAVPEVQLIIVAIIRRIGIEERLVAVEVVHIALIRVACVDQSVAFAPIHVQFRLIFRLIQLGHLRQMLPRLHVTVQAHQRLVIMIAYLAK